ncbi:MAG: AtpZ/AtpI family protein [Flavobacterium sp.]|jgi:F0F1-type ATP synthase assembly protein I
MTSPKQPNKWLVFLNIPFQMGIAIVGFSYLGSWLDEKYGNSDGLYLKISTLFGVFIAMYTVIQQVNKLNKK